MALLGSVGWVLLAAPSLWPDLIGPVAMTRPDWLAVGMFLAVIVATRAMASRLMSDSVVSLDAGFYLAAAVCLGSLMSGRLVAVALLVDAMLRAGAQPPHKRRWIANMVYGLYFGGMSGGLLMLFGWVGKLDALYVLEGVSDARVFGRLMLVGGLFLLAHYGLQGARLVLEGERVESVVRKMIVPGIVAESAVLPLAVIMVFLYHPQQPLKFALMGTTVLVMNYAFHRLSGIRLQLANRVRELETLSSTSRRLAASLQIHELVESLAQEVLSVVPSADGVVLGHREGMEQGHQRFLVDTFDRQKVRFEREERTPHGPMAVVFAKGSSTYHSSLEPSERPKGLESVQSWLGVPIEIQGRVEGALAIYSETEHAFDDDTMHLMSAISAQAAIALQNVRLYELAMVDGLTGLYVRRYFDTRLREEFERTSRFESPFSVVMMDLDDFKNINDTYGHPVGDSALQAVAEVVQLQMRLVDTAARYGGEEIALILPRTESTEAARLAERIRQGIEALEVPNGRGKSLRLSVSVGIAAHPECGENAAGVLNAADRALYRAKARGKNRVELALAGDSLDSAAS